MKLIATKGWFVLAAIAAALPFIRFLSLSPEISTTSLLMQTHTLMQAAGHASWFIVVGLIYHLMIKISQRPEMIWLPVVHLFCATGSTGLNFYIDIQRMQAYNNFSEGDYEALTRHSFAIASTNSIFVLLGYLCFGIALVLAVRRFDSIITSTFD